MFVFLVVTLRLILLLIILCIVSTLKNTAIETSEMHGLHFPSVKAKKNMVLEVFDIFHLERISCLGRTVAKTFFSVKRSTEYRFGENYLRKGAAFIWNEDPFFHVRVLQQMHMPLLFDAKYLF